MSDELDTQGLEAHRDALASEREQLRAERERIAEEAQRLVDRRKIRTERARIAESLEALSRESRESLSGPLVFEPSAQVGVPAGTTADPDPLEAGALDRTEPAALPHRAVPWKWVVSGVLLLLGAVILGLQFGPAVWYGLVELPAVRRNPLAARSVKPGEMPARVLPREGHLWLPLGPAKLWVPGVGPRSVERYGRDLRLVYPGWELRYRVHAPRSLISRSVRGRTARGFFEDDRALVHECLELSPDTFSFRWSPEQVARFRWAMEIKLTRFPQLARGVVRVRVGPVSGYLFGRPGAGAQRLELFDARRVRHSYLLLPGSAGAQMFSYLRPVGDTPPQVTERLLARWTQQLAASARPAGPARPPVRPPAESRRASGPDSRPAPDPDRAAAAAAAAEAAREATARARSLEEDFVRLRNSQPEQAREALRDAIEVTADTAHKAALQAQLRSFDRLRQRRRLILTAPRGFLLASLDPPVYLSRARVRCADYLVFLRETGARQPKGWPGWGILQREADRPVAGVSRALAGRYAAWRGGRLPRQSELAALEGRLAVAGAEWVRSARSGQPRGFRLALLHGRSQRAVAAPAVLHELAIRSKPSGAQVTLDGRPVGPTPLRLRFYRSVSLRLAASHPGHLPTARSVRLAQPKQVAALHLFGASVIPSGLRDYRTRRSSALGLAALADRHATGGRRVLADTLYDLLHAAWPDDWAVLSYLRRHLAGGKREALLARISGRLARIDQKVDGLRTAHYRNPRTDLRAGLSRLGHDPHFGMRRVPAGNFKFGAEHPRAGEFRYRTRATGAFWIDVTEVTNRQYLRFIEATRHRVPRHLSGALPARRLDHPVTQVSLHDAQAYARWVGKRLPTQVEWEKAARGTLFRRYPYGQYFWSRACNSAEARKEGVTRVGSYPVGRSPYGILDMSGNVWEWTTSSWTTRSQSRQRTIKGGAFDSPRADCRVAARQGLAPQQRRPNLGFRCVSDGS